MDNLISPIRPGLIIATLTILFGLGMGIVFGTHEDNVKGWIKDGVAQHQTLHDEKSFSKIWRYSQRSHFHAMGVGSTTMALNHSSRNKHHAPKTENRNIYSHRIRWPLSTIVV